MVEIQPQEVAVGTIFSYEEALTESELRDFFQSEGFNVNDPSQQGINIGPDGQLALGPNPVYAQREDIQILLNLQADLQGYEYSSFITLKDQHDADFEEVLREVEKLWDNYHEFDISQEVDTVELTYSGVIRTDRTKHNISNFVKQNVLDEVEGISDIPPGSSAIRFEPGSGEYSEGWYKLLIDATQIQNPRKWGFKLTRRYNHYSEIDSEGINEAITYIVEQSTER